MTAHSDFEEYYRTHYLTVLRYIERRLSDTDLAADVCAECFVIAWRKFDPADPFPVVWLYQTARNLIGNTYRSRRKEQQLLALLRSEAKVNSTPTETAMVAEVLSGLNEKDREALRLTYWEQLSAADVASVLGCSEQAAWKRISRAKAALRKALVESSESTGGVL